MAPPPLNRPGAGGGRPQPPYRPTASAASRYASTPATPLASTSTSVATSHHRPEDVAPNESTSRSLRRPSAPPQLVQVDSLPRPQDANAPASSSTSSRGGRQGNSCRTRGSSLFIHKPRGAGAAGRATKAGGWSDASPPSRPRAAVAGSYGSLGTGWKGKERETEPYNNSTYSAGGPKPPFASTSSHPLPARPTFPPSSYADIPTGPSSSSYANTSAREAYGYSRPNAPHYAPPPQPLASPIPVPANPLPRTPKLYISHLPPGTAEQHVRSVFARYGSMYVSLSRCSRPLGEQLG